MTKNNISNKNWQTYLSLNVILAKDTIFTCSWNSVRSTLYWFDWFFDGCSKCLYICNKCFCCSLFVECKFPTESVIQLSKVTPLSLIFCVFFRVSLNPIIAFQLSQQQRRKNCYGPLRLRWRPPTEHLVSIFKAEREI